MDTWTGGWHRLFRALVGQLIHLLFLAGFSRSNPQFLGREGIQETEKDIVKRVQTGASTSAWKVSVESSLPDTDTVFQASVFGKGFRLSLY